MPISLVGLVLIHDVNNFDVAAIFRTIMWNIKIDSRNQNLSAYCLNKNGQFSLPVWVAVAITSLDEMEHV